MNAIGRTWNAPLKPHPRRSHLIETYSVARNHVRCDCGWEGNPDGFAEHRKAVGASTSHG